jgi:hypothetical protein
MSSDDLKTLAICWLRFKKQFDLVCTEDPSRNADAIGTESSIQCRKMIEIETKISISDLRADNRKGGHSRVCMTKHEQLAKCMEVNPLSEQFDIIHGTKTENRDHTVLPSQFYFMVPEELSTAALEVITALYPHTGLMVGKPCLSGHFTDQATVIKRAPVLHKMLIAKHIKTGISSRMTSEICGLRLDRMREKWSNISKQEVPNGTDGNDRTEVLSVEAPDGVGVRAGSGED